MHRNFMGYTTQNTKLLLGLGVSSISDVGVAFGQNNKLLQDYYETVNAGQLPVTRGYMLNQEDLDFRQYILDISCKGSTNFKPAHLILLYEYTFRELAPLQADGLLNYDERGLQVTPLGRHFIRNICKAFDLHLLRNELNSENQVFSKAI